MFKLKPGNVFQKINKMDRKQAYTIGAIVLVCFVALLTLASFLGNAEDTSFEDFNTRGYDLAQMPFLNDEAEEYLLASKYPDMQGNNSTMLYSAAEKEARQEEDAAAQEEAAGEEETAPAAETASSSYSGYSGYGGGYGGGRTATPTQVGKLSSASMGTASGRGVNATWGAPSGDFSPYKSQEKGSETPVQFKNQDARRALSQFAQGSRAAAGLRDSKGANAKKALMGGNILGSEAFTDQGVDLSKTGGLAIDPNAPVSSSDLGNLDDKVADAAKDAKNAKDEFEDSLQQGFWERLGEQLMSGLVDIGLKAGSQFLNQQMNVWSANMAGNSAFNDSLRAESDQLFGKSLSELSDSEIEMLKQSQPNDRNGNPINWDSLKETNGSESVGALWVNGNDCKKCQKDFFNGKTEADTRNTGMKNYYKEDTSSEAYIAANEKRENARTIAYGRLQGKTNIISQGIDATDAPPGGTATRKGSSSTYKSVSDVLNSGRTQQEQVTILQKEFNLSKAAAETQIYGSPVTNL